MVKNCKILSGAKPEERIARGREEKKGTKGSPHSSRGAHARVKTGKKSPECRKVGEKLPIKGGEGCGKILRWSKTKADQLKSRISLKWGKDRGKRSLLRKKKKRR